MKVAKTRTIFSLRVRLKLAAWKKSQRVRRDSRSTIRKNANQPVKTLAVRSKPGVKKDEGVRRGNEKHQHQ